MGSTNDPLVPRPTTRFQSGLQHVAGCWCSETSLTENFDAKEAMGFSNEVDSHLVESARLNTSPERERCIIILMDEIHV